MPKSTFSAWVKNVYSLFTLEGTNSEQLPTTLSLSAYFPTQPVHKTPSFPRFIPVFPLQFSPLKIASSPLLNNHLYPLSTPPINTKTKGK